MSNRLSITTAWLCIGVMGADLAIWDGTHLLFLARKLADLIDWLAFWRG